MLGLIGLGLGLACDHAPPPAAPVLASSGVPSSAPPLVAFAPASATATPSAMAAASNAPPAPTPAPASTCAKGQIDACGECYPPCDTDADCKVKGQTCQPIVCTHTFYGNGCVPDASSTASAGAPVAAAPPSDLECRAKSGTQTFELFVHWQDGNVSSGTLRTTPAAGKPITQAITAEMVKGLVLVHPARGPRDKTLATEQTDPSKSLQVGDFKQPWMPCQ
jgi:hypothetical protein